MSTQDLRKRIKSVQNTQQITKAMKMVASARLHKAQQKALSTTPYAKKLYELLQHVFRASSDHVDPLGEQREVKKRAFVIIGADKGLAGAYNANVMKKATQIMSKYDKEDYIIVTIGRKPVDFLKHGNYPIVKSYAGFSDNPTADHARGIAEELKRLFIDHTVDSVDLIYTHFINTMTYEVKIEHLLPVEYEADESVETIEYLYEPNEEVVLNLLLPKVISFTVYNALLQACASELGSRMTAMTTASDNAAQLIDSLNLEYNRLRQAQITNEISEIIGGANALA